MKIKEKNISFMDDVTIKHQIKPNLGQFNLNPYSVSIFVGQRGSGKTTCALNIIRKMKPYLNGIIGILSPTYLENKFLFDATVGTDDNVIILTPTSEGINEYMEHIRLYKEKVDQEKEYFQLYFKKHKDDWDYEMLEMVGFREPDMFLIQTPICHNLIIDDVASIKNIMSRHSKLNHLLLNSRHLRTNMLICLQNLKLLNKAARENCSDIFLFQTKDINGVLLQAYELFQGLISKDDFLYLFENSIIEKSDHLWITLNPQKRWLSPFRKNFNYFLTLE